MVSHSPRQRLWTGMVYTIMVIAAMAVFLVVREYGETLISESLPSLAPQWTM
jgi:hypothetical protein